MRPSDPSPLIDAMAYMYYSFIDGHESINQTMRYLEKKYLKASIAHKEALQNRDMLLAERERRVARYFEALIDAEAHIQAAKVRTDEDPSAQRGHPPAFLRQLHD